MAPNPRDQKWHSLAEQASREMDPKKLTLLVDQLCSALDERGKPLAIQMLPII
ncbi:MAG: hypothetical protein JWQ87_5206 [Candidatus Sulfotelmatobacter sp.]|nr:hypothetical protein [Candidatus Sulfotelmatobacter sp.]